MLPTTVPQHLPCRPRERGLALVTALVLLIALTIVATVAMRNSGFELRMSENQVQRSEAFENAELPRGALGDLVDQHALARGWPADRGGDVSAVDFRFEWPEGFTVAGLGEDGATPLWYVRNSECAPLIRCALPAPDGLDEKAVFARQLPVGTGNATRDVQAGLKVFKLRTDLAPGSGAAMVSGYLGLGRAAAAGGARILFHVESESNATRAVRTSAGQDVAGRSTTAATFRHVIRN